MKNVFFYKNISNCNVDQRNLFIQMKIILSKLKKKTIEINWLNRKFIPIVFRYLTIQFGEKHLLLQLE